MLASARWETKATGLVALSHDWRQDALPTLALNEPAKLTNLERADVRAWAMRSGCWIENGFVHFFLWKPLCPDAADESLAVMGPFNQWGAANLAKWTLHAVCLLGAEGFEAIIPLDEVMQGATLVPFKFCRTDGRWLEPPHDADNILRDDFGNRNLCVSLERTNQHVFRFTAMDADPVGHPTRVLYEREDLVEFCEVTASDPLDVLEPPGPFGATVFGGVTTFRLFAPRAVKVSVGYVLADSAVKIPSPQYLELQPEGQGAWVGTVEYDLSNYPYFLNVDGKFVSDPWAKKMAHSHPAPPVSIVCPPEELLPLNDGFVAPVVEDLVIVEAHVRDLLGLAGEGAKPGFRGLAKWIREDGGYLRSLGVNAIELLPCTDYERGDADEYHWGYMPITAFAPATAYAENDNGLSAVEDFRDLAKACHEVGLAVIMDLVLNHFGGPNSLEAIDASYYYRTDAHGLLTNWSGCGNDVRAEAPMFRRLVLASLSHWTSVLGVDGVRLDLAELLGTPLLHEIEQEFRWNAPNKILIAEPWSFRGHIARDLDFTTWTSWDDAFREFLPAYVRGNARASDLLHQMAACAFRPSARLRYAQSHDDMAWLDRITECAKCDGLDPRTVDILRTRMMHVILLCSAGIPMLSAGQDFLMTKRGVANTWRRADLNLLDPIRLERFRAEHDFVADLIRFRLSPAGAVMRPKQIVSADWMMVTQQEGGEAFVAVLNADGALGSSKVMVACNPGNLAVELKVPVEAAWAPVVASPFPSCQLAPGPMPKIDQGVLRLEPLGCGVWVVKG